MSALRHAWQRCLAVLAPRRLDREFDDEAESHIALAADDYVQRGMPRGEAERLARRAFGSVAASKDAHRDARSLPSLEALVYDLRVAARGLRRDWTFTAAAVAMLAIAIGLNVTISVIADAMLFRGYPLVTRGDRLLQIQERARSGITPTIVAGTVSMCTARPTMSARPPKRAFQNRSLRMATGGAPDCPSAGVKSRPRAGATPSR